MTIPDSVLTLPHARATRGRRSRFLFAAGPLRAFAGTLFTAALVAGSALLSPGAGAAAQELGPVDGADLPATDIERVAVGGEAPLFALESFGRGRVELASFRGRRNVVLVFYRGHW